LRLMMIAVEFARAKLFRACMAVSRSWLEPKN